MTGKPNVTPSAASHAGFPSRPSAPSSGHTKSSTIWPVQLASSQSGGAGASADVNHAFGSLMMRGAALALADVHISQLDFNLSTTQCEMINVLTALPDEPEVEPVSASSTSANTVEKVKGDAHVVASSTKPGLASVPESVVVDTAVEAIDARKAEGSKGWISWAWGVVVGEEGEDGSTEDIADISTPTVATPSAKHDAVTIINAHIGGLSFTLHRRVMVPSKRRRASITVEEPQRHQPSPHSAQSPGPPGAGRAESPTSQKSESVGRLDTAGRQVIQVPVANVGFVAVPVTPLHAPIMTLQSVPFLTLLLETTVVQLRIHDVHAGHEIAPNGRVTSHGKFPLQILDGFVDVGCNVSRPCHWRLFQRSFGWNLPAVLGSSTFLLLLV
jgi:hypothetical protein